MSEGFAHDQRREGAESSFAEGLPLAPPGHTAPGCSELASTGSPSQKADAGLPVLTEKAPASPPKKACVSPPDNADASHASPPQASDAPSDRADSSSSGKAPVPSSLWRADGSLASQSGFSPPCSLFPSTPAESSSSKESPPTKSVDPTTFTPCRTDATSGAQPATELYTKVSGLTKADALSGGEEEDDRWRLPAHHTPASSEVSNSTEPTSIDEHRAAASGDLQPEGEAADGHSGLQPASIEIAAAAGESPLQTAQKLPSSTSALSFASSCGVVNGTKDSPYAAAAISAIVGTGKSGGPSEAAQVAAESSPLRTFELNQQVVRMLPRPRPDSVLLKPVLLKDKSNSAQALLKVTGTLAAPHPLTHASTHMQTLHNATLRSAERVRTASLWQSSSASGCSLGKSPADTLSTETEETARGSSEAPRCSLLQKPTHPSEFRGMKRILFKISSPSEQKTASWHPAPAHNAPHPPPHMRPSALSFPSSPSSVLPWGRVDMDMPPAKGPSMGMYAQGPGTLGPAVHRVLNLPPTVTSSLQGKHCLYEIPDVALCLITCAKAVLSIVQAAAITMSVAASVRCCLMVIWSPTTLPYVPMQSRCPTASHCHALQQTIFRVI